MWEWKMPREEKEEEFLKGKDMDYSSKFLGTYANDDKKPWYAKRKG